MGQRGAPKTLQRHRLSFVAGRLGQYSELFKRNGMQFLHSIEETLFLLLVLTAILCIDVTAILFLCMMAASAYGYSQSIKTNWRWPCAALFVVFYILSWKVLATDAVFLCTIYVIKHFNFNNDPGGWQKKALSTLSVLSSIFVVLSFFGYVMQDVKESTESFVCVQLLCLLYGLSKTFENVLNFQFALNLLAVTAILYNHLELVLAAEIVAHWMIYRKFSSVVDDWLFVIMQSGLIYLQYFFLMSSGSNVDRWTFPTLCVGALFCYIGEDYRSWQVCALTVAKVAIIEWFVLETHTITMVLGGCYACYCIVHHFEIPQILKELVSNLTSAFSDHFCQFKSSNQQEPPKKEDKKKQQQKVTAATPALNGTLRNRSQTPQEPKPSDSNNNFRMKFPIKNEPVKMNRDTPTLEDERNKQEAARLALIKEEFAALDLSKDETAKVTLSKEESTKVTVSKESSNKVTVSKEESTKVTLTKETPKVKEVAFKEVKRKNSKAKIPSLASIVTSSPISAPVPIPDYALPSPQTPGELISNPIQSLRTDWQENVVSLEIPHLGDAIKLRPWHTFKFPQQFANLLDLKELTDKTLESTELFKIITSKPSKLNPVINKQVALLALQWAHDLFICRYPIMQDVTLSYLKHRVLQKRSGKPTEVEFEFTFETKKLLDEHRMPSKGDMLTFKFSNTDAEALKKAKVIWIDNESLKLVTWVWNTEDLNGRLELQRLLNIKEVRVDVYEYFSQFLYASMLRSIARIRRSDDETQESDERPSSKAPAPLDDFIVPKPNFPTGDYLFKKKRLNLVPSLQKYAGLNTEQAMALYAICTSSNSPYPFILHGPPGTGKTHTIVATVRCLLEMDPQIRILLAAPSNSATDLLALKLFRELPRGLIKKSEILRLRSQNADYFDRNKELDPISNFDPDLNAFDIPSYAKLINHRLIISTLGCTMHIIDQGLPPGFFTHIIVDEAGQATETELWLPVGGLATKKTSIVLCGDPKQLGPVIKVDLKQYTTDKFGSALVRYMDQQHNLQSEPRVFCQLVRSYRCHPAILGIASRLFYGGSLIPEVDGREEPFENWKCLPNKKFPVLFISVYGDQSFNASNSCANETEAKVVISYIARLLRDFPTAIRSTDIGVVSPYAFQIKMIRDKFKERGIDVKNWMTIDTIEKYQGAERRVLIISTVRNGSLGFVANDLELELDNFAFQRLNTSITRAKNLLIVVGHAPTLRRHPSWNIFVDYCESNGSLIEWQGETGIQDFP